MKERIIDCIIESLSMPEGLSIHISHHWLKMWHKVIVSMEGKESWLDLWEESERLSCDKDTIHKIQRFINEFYSLVWNSNG